MKRLWKGISIAVALILILGSVAYAYSFYIDYQVKETAGTSYTMLPVYGVANNANYAATGMISATGLNTRVYDADNSTAPHMLTTDKTWFAIPVPGNNTKIVRYGLGVSPALTEFKIIPGYSGNITIVDNTTLELGSIFDLSISGYFDTSTGGTSKAILYKSGALLLNISAVNTVTFHMLNAGNTDNWTISGAISPGLRTVRVASDGSTVTLYVGGVAQATKDISPTATWTAGVGDVGTVPSGYFSYQKMTWYGQGRYWVFFVMDSADTGHDLWYTSSTDLNSWAAAIQITDTSVLGLANNPIVSDFNTWYDATNNKLSYVWGEGVTATGHGTLFYRVGQLVSDGSITWLAAEQSFTGSTAVNFVAVPEIIVTTTGEPIIFADYVGGDAPKLYMSTTYNGTWTMKGGYPLNEVSTSASGHTSHLIQLLSGQALLVRYGSVEPGYVAARKYNGSAWAGADETVTTAGNGYQPPAVSMVSNNSGDCLIFYVKDPFGARPMYFKVRYANGSYSSETSFGTSDTVNPSVSYDPVSDTFYIFYTSTNVYYKTFKNGVLSAAVQATPGDKGTIVSQAMGVQGHTLLAGMKSDGTLTMGELVHGWTWNDNANSWLTMAANTMSYGDNMTVDVSGTRVLTFKPTAIISGTTLVDESGNGNNGTFNWGGIPAGVLVTPIAYGTGATPSIPRQPHGFTMPAFPIPQSWFNVGKDLSHLPFYDSFLAVSLQTGQPVQVMYFLLILGLAFGAFLIAVMFTRLAIFGVVCFNLVLFFGSQQGVVPSWMVFALAIIQVAILYLYKQVSY